MHLRVIDNPANPYQTRHAEWLEPPPEARVEVYEETARSILSENQSPDLPFRWSANPYRGCQHACAYCYARPYHEYLDWGAGTDFDTKIVAKVNAPELLRAAITRRGWQRGRINFSGVTDCYQPIEASYEITRRCLEVCRDLANPVAVVTKGCLVVRDAELLADIHRRAGAMVFLSIPFADREVSKLIEPQAPPPERRFETIRRLREAGVPAGVFIAPVIPGLTDRDIPRIIEQAAAAGATSAGMQMLRLADSVREVFVSRLRTAMPHRAEAVLKFIRDMRGGELNDSRFGRRMRGEGPRWESIVQLFELAKRRHGLAEIEDRPIDGAPCPALPALPETPRRQLMLDFE
jgi:DNA repair photolyase